jgi:hypothetical protein
LLIRGLPPGINSLTHRADSGLGRSEKETSVEVERVMTSAEVREVVEAEVGSDYSQSNAHGVDLRRCLVQPRNVSCRNTFPKLNSGKPLQLWIVLEETPGEREGYLIVFDDRQRLFGLADWDGDTPVFLGFHGSFLDTLQGM